MKYTKYFEQQHIIINPMFFISSILEYRTNILSLSESKFIIAWDNSSIHKSKLIMKYLKKSKIIILKIWPYYRELNLAEKMIL